MSRPFKNLLLTGPPGCGKTTCVCRLAERLGDLRRAGFFTAEVREGGNRAGFAAVGLSAGRHAVLAHVRSKSRHRVGRYGVEPAALARLVVTELGRPAGEVQDRTYGATATRPGKLLSRPALFGCPRKPACRRQAAGGPFGVRT